MSAGTGRGRRAAATAASAGSGEVPAAGGPDERYLIPYLLNRTAARMQQLWRTDLGGRGPTLPQFQVLSILSAVDGARVGVIAQMAGVDQPVMSRVIDQMERAGLVERRPAVNDLRAVEVWTTRSGRASFASGVPRAAEFVDWTLRGFDAGEVRCLHALLARLLAGLDEESER